MKLKYLFTLILILFTVSTFAQQYDANLIPYRKGNLWGYANADKTIAIKPAYAEATWFVGGLAAVKKGKLYGYINKQGKLVIPYKFYTAKPFMYGYFDNTGKHNAGGKLVKNQDTVLFAGASLKPNGNEVCIDTKGRTMSKCPAINENRPDNRQPLVSVTTEKVYSVAGNANVYDKLVDDYKLPADAATYYVGLKNNKYGVINNTFDVLVPFEFDSIKKADINGTTYLQVLKNGMYGMYTGNGSIFIPVENNKLAYVKSGEGTFYFIETKNGAATLKDLNNKDVLNASLTDIVYDDERGFILTGKDKTKGYYFLNSNMIAPKYSEVRLVKGGNFLMVKNTNGKMGYVGADGTEYFEDL